MEPGPPCSRPGTKFLGCIVAIVVSGYPRRHVFSVGICGLRRAPFGELGVGEGDQGLAEGEGRPRTEVLEGQTRRKSLCGLNKKRPKLGQLACQHRSILAGIGNCTRWGAVVLHAGQFEPGRFPMGYTPPKGSCLLGVL